ncbi:hypothetical protein WA158_000771 [Blastocystis sp. Blastoise]
MSVDLAKLNEFMLSHSYVCGYKPTQLDLEVAKACGCVCGCEYPHAARWFKHIHCFACAEKKNWPAAECDLPFMIKAEEKKEEVKEEEEEEEGDLFGDDDDDEDEAAAEEMAAKLAADAKKKKEEAKKNEPVARSQLVLDVKPLEAETDLNALADKIKATQVNGLKWGEGIKIVPLAFGICKLQVSCIIEDDICCEDDVYDAIQQFEDDVQSVETFAFNKM